MTVTDALHHASQVFLKSGISTARLDAELLLSHVLVKDRAWVFTHIDDVLDAGHERLYQELVDRRAHREPIQYILGRQEFWGLEFIVTRDVLIPRPETELVVETAIRSLQGIPKPAIIDLCTGSGCIAVSLAKEFPASRIFATDTSDRALGIARENARMHGATERIRFLEGDLFHQLEELDIRGQVDLITANPPYIPSRELPGLQPEVRDFEPEQALIAGPNGTEFHERIIAGASSFLKRQGSLIMEMGIGQAETLVVMAARSGAYAGPEILKDLAGIDRVIKMQKK